MVYAILKEEGEFYCVLRCDNSGKTSVGMKSKKEVANALRSGIKFANLDLKLNLHIDNEKGLTPSSAIILEEYVGSGGNVAGFLLASVEGKIVRINTEECKKLFPKLNLHNAYIDSNGDLRTSYTWSRKVLASSAVEKSNFMTNIQ